MYECMDGENYGVGGGGVDWRGMVSVMMCRVWWMGRVGGCGWMGGVWVCFDGRSWFLLGWLVLGEWE